MYRVKIKYSNNKTETYTTKSQIEKDAIKNIIESLNEISGVEADIVDVSIKELPEHLARITSV